MCPNIAGEYVRRSVGKDIDEFEGWDVVLERYARIKKEQEWDVSQVYTGCFLNGSRIMEILSAKAEMFKVRTLQVTLTVEGRKGDQVTRPVIEVKNLPLEKHYKKLSAYIETLKEKELPKNVLRKLYMENPDGTYSRKRYHTEKIEEVRRPFAIPFDEVPKKEDMRIMHEDFKAFLREQDGETWLYGSHVNNQVHMTESFIWKIFKLYGIYPHYLRGQRASCLISWNGLTMEQMMEWMTWEDIKTAMHYGKMGKTKLLGVFNQYV